MKLLQERIVMYQLAETNAVKSGDTVKSKRYIFCILIEWPIIGCDLYLQIQQRSQILKRFIEKSSRGKTNFNGRCTPSTGRVL